MATSTTQAPQWEKVGKSSNKKGKSQIPQLTKTERKNFIENMPRIEVAAPLKEDETMYGVFLEKERKEAAAMTSATKTEKHTSSAVKANGEAGKKAIPKKKKVVEQEKKPKLSDLDSSIASIDPDEVKSTLTKTQTYFPDNIEVWLKDLASYLNLKLEKVPELDPILKGKPKDFPVCQLPKKCQTTINSVIKQASTDTVEHLFYHCVQTMLTELGKGNSTYGYRIFIQLLSRARSDVVLSKVSQYLELLKANHNKASRSLTILWALGQCGNFDLRSGLKVWVEIMQPSLRVRALSNYCVEYLQELFSTHPDLKKVYGQISIREYFHILDLIYGDHQMPVDLCRKLQALYPNLKKIAYGGTDTNMRNLFPSYLTRANTSCSRLMKTELMSCLLHCLSTDKQCYSVWVQMYVKYLQQSSVLVQHLLDTWEESSSVLDKKLLKETLRSFSITNDELLSTGKANMEGFDVCAGVVKTLLQKLEHGRFPWFWVMFLMITTVSAIVAYDIYFSKSVKASRTMQFLEDYGVLAFTQQIWGRIQLYTNKAYTWLSVNMPMYYNKVQTAVGPYCVLAWNRVTATCTYLAEVTLPWRTLLQDKMVQLMHWIYDLSPDSWEKLWNYMRLSWNFLWEYCQWIWGQVMALLLSSYKWIEHNIILSEYTPGSVQKAVQTGISSVHNMTSHIVHWCQTLFVTPQNGH